MAIELVTAWVMVIALLVYVLLGGADFGAGVWDLLAAGPRRAQQREALDRAIGPIWEANHVWLIVVVVLMFTCFPPAFAAITTALHVPLTLVLLGIVGRGTAFTFRTYSGDDRSQARWGLVFSIASLVTPVLLGVSLGATAAGRLRWEEQTFVSGFFRPWAASGFTWAVGLFALAIFAFLAAVYLCAELAGDDDGDPQPRELREQLLADFRRRALGAGVAVGITAGLAWVLALIEAPTLSTRLAGSWWTIPLQLLTGACAVGALLALWWRRYFTARALVVVQVSFIVLGYAGALFPHLVVPDILLSESAAPAQTHRLVLIALAAGAVILLPSLAYLLRVFKGRRAFALLDQPPGRQASDR